LLYSNELPTAGYFAWGGPKAEGQR
jgi:hypothetical protein